MANEQDPVNKAKEGHTAGVGIASSALKTLFEALLSAFKTEAPKDSSFEEASSQQNDSGIDSAEPITPHFNSEILRLSEGEKFHDKTPLPELPPSTFSPEQESDEDTPKPPR